ncbi:ricin-type beta-trefoil lectin domain protein [Streptomyces sp. NPDC002668]|uniref:RICIN domain-containing protein n=1 Tax=Streptomyces sp. NPDC002668 TaxID=3154422 RepID=UPI00331895EB
MRKKSWAAVATGALAVATLAVGSPPASATDIYSRLVNYKSGRCLSLEGGGGTANGTEVILWTCNGRSEQAWDYSAGHQWYNEKAGKCMSTAAGGGTSNGTKVIIYNCLGSDEQHWDYVG